MLYSSVSSLSTLGQINLDGTGAQPGLSAPVVFRFDRLASNDLSYYNVGPSTPSWRSEFGIYNRGVDLGGDRGVLRYYVSSWPGVARGLVQLRPDGVVDFPLVYTPPFGSLGFSNGVTTSFKPDGTMVAAVVTLEAQQLNKLVLIRTDGTPFGNGKPSCDLLAATSFFNSPVFAKQHVYVMTSPGMIFRARNDCKPPLGAVALPKIGPLNPPDSTDCCAVSEDGSKVALSRGAEGQRSVLVIDDLSGAVITVPDKPGDVAGVGSNPLATSGFFPTTLAISPGGKHVAWIYVKPNDELYLRRTDKSLAAIPVTVDANFAPGHGKVEGLFWANDDDLLFVTNKDIFAYRVAAAKVINLTGTGGKVTPFTGVGTIRPLGAWISRNKKWIYFYYKDDKDKDSPKFGMGAINRSTLQLKVIVDDGIHGSTLEPVAKSSTVFFRAHQKGAVSEVYAFDQDTASTPQQLTALGGDAMEEHIYLWPARDGSAVAFAVKDQGSDLHDLYLAQVKPKSVVTRLTKAPGVLSRTCLFSPDGRSVVYGFGATTTNQQLRVQPISGGPAKVLRVGLDTVEVHAVW